MRTIRRSFLPNDLQLKLPGRHLRCNHAQARQILDETDFLLEQANANDFIKGVVGWGPLTDANITEVLDRYKSADKLKVASRRARRSTASDGEEFNRGIQALKHRASFTMPIFERQPEEAIRFIDRHPNQVRA